jgi:hypothetical protein
MDASQEYVKMCREADELQFNHKFETGHYWWNGMTTLLCISGRNEEPLNPFSTECLGEIIWLPTQDQLQEMLPELTIWNKIFLAYTHGKERTIPDTMEKLWLEIVMNMRFNKDWNGQTWIAAEQLVSLQRR